MMKAIIKSLDDSKSWQENSVQSLVSSYLEQISIEFQKKVDLDALTREKENLEQDDCELSQDPDTSNSVHDTMPNI